MVETTNELVKVVETSGLELQTANTLKEKFLPFFEKAEEWENKAKALIVTDISQTREMKMAREARLALRDIRVDADKTRKLLKEDSTRYGKAVQGVYNVIEYLITPIEKHLEEQEKFAEIQEAKRKAILKSDREIELHPFAEFVPFGIDLANMNDEDYKKLLNGAKLQLQAKINEEQKAKDELLARQKAEAEEREKIRIENEKLKAATQKLEDERKKQEETARKNKAIVDAKLKEEREARLKLEAELKAKIQSEEKAKKEASEKLESELKAKKDADRKAKAAPDKIKLELLAKQIDGLLLPELKSDEAQKILSDTKKLLQKLSGFIREKSSVI